MRNPPRNNPPIRIPNRKALSPPVFLLPCFPCRRAIPLHSCHYFAGRTPPTSSPDTKACIPAAGLPSCHSVFPHHPSLLRPCFRAHLHSVPRPPHSSSSHPSDAHCPPVPLTQACASSAGLSALPIRLSAPGASACTAPSHSPPVRRAHLRTPIARSVRTLRQPIPGRTKKQRMSETSAVFQL